MRVTPQLRELLLQALEHERGGVLIYQTALECAVDADLRQEWTGYLEQTLSHVDILTRVCMELALDPDEMTPGRQIVHHTGKSLVVAMKMALAAANAEAAQLVACDCVVLAETKDHANWELIGACAKARGTAAAELLQGAYDQVEDQEDEHLYHTKGWCRELWRRSLGLPAELPPLEEKRGVKSAAGAAEVQQQRKTGGRR